MSDTKMNGAESLVHTLLANDVQAANIAPGQIVSLILPSDTAWDEGGMVYDALVTPAPDTFDQANLTQAVEMLDGPEGRGKRPYCLGSHGTRPRAGN